MQHICYWYRLLVECGNVDVLCGAEALMACSVLHQMVTALLWVLISAEAAVAFSNFVCG